MRKPIKFILGVIACVLLAGNAGHASCAKPTNFTITIADEFRGADAVFLGRVKKIRRAEWFSGDTVAVDFEVERSWKLVDTDAITIYAEPKVDTSFRFMGGETYVVYARKWEGKLYPAVCGKTASIENAREQMADLTGRDIIPLQKAPSYESMRIALITLISVLVFFGIGYGVKRLTRRAA